MRGDGAHSLQYESKTGFKEKKDPICLTKAEMKRMDDWLRKNECKFLKKKVVYE
jgi:hypothetical protein